LIDSLTIHSCEKITSALSEYLQRIDGKSGVNEAKRKGNKFDYKSVVSPCNPAVLKSVAEYLNLLVLVIVRAKQQLLLEI
jgi:hypothetical protein